MSEEDKKLSKYASLENIVKNSFYEVNKDEIECQICNLLIIGPMQCPDCQNSLCSNCAVSCKKCPFCRKEVVFKKSIMINKLLSKLSFKCENCSKEVLYNDLISHNEESGKCKKSESSGDDKYREKYFEALEKIKLLEIENSKLKNKLESMEYKFKFSEDKNNETIKSLKSMNDILLQREKDNKDMLMRSIELNENLKRSISSEIDSTSFNTFEGQRSEEKFKSKFHNHVLIYRKPVNYDTARCDICRRIIYDIKNYHCSQCGYDMCPTCKSMEEEKDLALISTPLHKHPLEYHGNKNIAFCVLCKNGIDPYKSYRCEMCNFDSCDQCFKSYKW